ncbi:hypothetical protein T8K17_07200 [Thalassobaculum sp. OXR-137]|uniref:hypothetical protein n=1 Tax=Thalassobaculum sp. OXR-137 TaxID=3100173 RepID=UPI002AC90554|nr:hypothetical protein [Thalassobaculum sp. OXR-137]WPZ35919.1 hypothetical protein T8K17_07200 [Thalassobaculum sp. OXR-137]
MPKSLLRAAGLSLLLAPVALSTATAAERLVVQEPDLLVVVDREVGCGEITELTIRSSDPDLFRKDSARMQRVVDGTRAILGFECARTPAFNITGEDNRTGDVVFRGTAGDPTRWLVQSSQALAAAPSGSGSTVGSGASAGTSGSGNAGSGTVSLGGDAVGGVRTGMTVAEATNAAGGDFAGKPVYRRDLQALVAGDDDCVGRLQSNTRLFAGQRCLVAQTVETDPPRIYQTILHQAVDQDQREQIVAQLEDRFGRPAKRERGELPGSSWNNAGNKYTLLSWRAPLDRPIEASARPSGIDPVTYELEALVVSYGETTEVTLWSSDTALLSRNPQIKAKF